MNLKVGAFEITSEFLHLIAFKNKVKDGNSGNLLFINHLMSNKQAQSFTISKALMILEQIQLSSS